MIYGGGMAFVPAGNSMFPTTHEENPHLPSTSPTSCAHLQEFHGVSNSVLMRRSMSFSGMEDHHAAVMMRGGGGVDVDEMSEDDGGGGGLLQLGEKKKRLNLEQVKALEKSFELGNKLEPERKMQLARALGLQPRQIAIWFQNRRARWKTKQLERDYDILKRQFEALKADNDALKSQNNKLQSQLLTIQNRESSGNNGMINLNKENDVGTAATVSWSSDQENNINVNLMGRRLIRTVSSGGRATAEDGSGGVRNNINHGSSQLLRHHTAAADLQPGSDEGFCNLFNAAAAIEEQPGFWTWSTVTDQVPHPTFIN